MIPDMFVKLSWPNWVFALTVLGLILLSYFYYYRTLPPLSATRRWIVRTLRALSLCLVLFLLLEPAVELLHRQAEKPVVAVLLDNSASMNIRDRRGIRRDSLRYVQENLAQLGGYDSLDIERFAFDLHARRLRDSLDFSVDGTDISEALRAVQDSLADRNLQAVVLVSDGIYNRGPNPLLTARRSPVPIYTVILGDSTPPQDIALRRVQTNQITFVNKKLPVEVVIWHNGYEGQKALLTISHGQEVLARRMITLGKSGFEQKETLEIVARKPGDFNYTVAVQPQAGEITERNNQRTVRVQVLKSKIKVLVMGGSPNFDRHFLSFVSKQLKDFQFTFLTEKAPGQYYEGALERVPLDSQDVFIFHGFPTRKTDPAHLRRLMRTVQRRRAPILWFFARSSHFAQLQPYDELLPWKRVVRLVPVENQFVRLTPGGRHHPVCKLDENETANELLWSELPPLEIYRPVQMRPGGQVLLEMDPRQEVLGAGMQNVPVCFTYRRNEIKQLVFNGANFGHWHFQLQEDPARDRFLIRFLDRAIRWLANREDIHRIQIRPLQQIYNVGEAVVFSGQVYDEFYQPIPDAEVVISIEGDTLRFSDEMIAGGNGYYHQTFSGLPEGEFRYRIQARRNDQEIGERTGTFTVKPFFLEYQEIPANAALLRQLARQTGGRAYSPGQFLRNFPDRPLESRLQLTMSEYFLWSYWQWIILLVLLLSTEWFLRKRWGLL